jgi:hypothetical protein
MANAGYGGPVVMQGGQPTLGAYHMHDYGPALPAGTDPAILAARQAQMHRQAQAYALQRFRQMQRISSQLSPELQAALHTAMAGPDAAAGWRGFSGQFAQASRAAGYNDPRYWLQRVLPAAVAAAGGHGPVVT